jgi:hypothetical protein
MGRCQGFYCTGAVVSLFAEASGRSMAELLGVPPPARGGRARSRGAAP